MENKKENKLEKVMKYLILSVSICGLMLAVYIFCKLIDFYINNL